MTTQHPESEWLDKVLDEFLFDADSQMQPHTNEDLDTQQSLANKEYVAKERAKAKSQIEAKLKSAEERAYKQGWDSAGGEAMEETHQKELKSAEIEGQANEALAMVFLVDIEKYPEANKLVAERSLELEAQLKTIKEAV